MCFGITFLVQGDPSAAVSIESFAAYFKFSRINYLHSFIVVVIVQRRRKFVITEQSGGEKNDQVLLHGAHTNEIDQVIIFLVYCSGAPLISAAVRGETKVS